MNISKIEKLEEIGLNCIYNSDIGKIQVIKVLDGEDNFIIKGLIEQQIYYFKFFYNANIEKIKAEIQVVNFLRNNDIIVPEFYKKNGQILFENKTHDIAFYASKELKGNNKYSINKKLLEEIIDSISNMHKKIITIDESKINLKENTDKDRIEMFYNNNMKFLTNNGIDKYIKLVIENKSEKNKKYPIHSDLYFKNIIFNDSKVVGFIDFSDIRKSYIEDDLGKLFQNLLCVHNFTINTIEELIWRYKEKMNIFISDKNIYISILYRTVYRYYMEYKESDFKKEKFEEVMNIISKKIIRREGMI